MSSTLSDGSVRDRDVLHVLDRWHVEKARKGKSRVKRYASPVR